MAYTFPSLWWGTHVSKVSANKVYRKNCLLEFWKENNVIGLNSCYLFNVEHGTEHDIDIAYGAILHALDIP